jgi:predicted dehydrogenase
MVARIGDPLGEQEVVLQGEAASLRANLAFGSSGMQLQLARGDELWQPVAIPDHYFEGVDRTKPFLEQMLAMFARQSIGSRLFVDGILADRAVVPSFYEGWKAQQVIDAAIASSESGCWAEVQQSTGSLAE